MLQIAHATATIANNGLKMRPHIVREVLDVETKAPTSVAERAHRSITALA
jgi:cell division protein FtsI/penicillin-binding protein 2